MADPILTTEQVDALLKKLSTDETYRELFQSDLEAAFKQLPGAPKPPANLPPGCCLRPIQLASPEQLAATRNAIRDHFLSKAPQQPHILEA